MGAGETRASRSLGVAPVAAECVLAGKWLELGCLFEARLLITSISFSAVQRGGCVLKPPVCQQDKTSLDAPPAVGGFHTASVIAALQRRHTERWFQRIAADTKCFRIADS